MNYDELMSIKVIPKDIAKSQSKSLVNNLYHTPYKDEIRLFSCIKQGNLKKLIFEMTQLGIQNITVGQMSDDAKIYGCKLYNTCNKICYSGRYE